MTHTRTAMVARLNGDGRPSAEWWSAPDLRAARQFAEHMAAQEPAVEFAVYEVMERQNNA